MKKAILFLTLFFTGVFYSQSFIGTTGNISDDGQANDFTATASGLPTVLGAGSGLVRVCLNISHTYDSDLNITLISPDGASINLFSGIGGDGDNFTNTCLSQTAPMLINLASAPFTGVFRPQETLGNLNDGGNGNGIWTMRIVDTYPADAGIVNGWSIELGPDASVPFVFTASNLPIVLINTGGNAIPDEPKIDATMKIIYNGEGNVNHVTDLANNYDGNIGIELRGNYSQGLPQKPYKFETRDAVGAELNAPLVGMPSEHDWCLIANYNDKVFMRNTMAYDFFTEMGHYATRSRYCEVVLNGSYQGIYMLTESIKRDGSRVDIAKLETTENSGVNVTGGYIIKNDYWQANDSWLLNYHPIDHPGFNVHLVYDYPKPDDITEAQKSYIQNFINDFETVLYSPQFDDPANGYNKYIDADSFIDYFIVNELSRNNDGFKKSSYFYKDIDPATGISKLKAGPVWDFDWAWKNINECSIFAATDGSGWAHHINDCNPDVNSPGWYVRLLQDPAFQDKLRCRWAYFRSTFLADSEIESYIDNKASYLDMAQSRHFEKWGNLGLNTGTPEVDADPSTFAGEISKFKNWIALRLAWLDANIPGNVDNCSLLATNSHQFNANKLTVSPNPANDKFEIGGVGKAPDLVEVFNVEGKLVLQSTMANTVNVSKLSNGLYLCRITVGNVVKSTKLAVQHQ